MFEFEEKVVVITGAARGIGKCIAEDFVSKKAKVVIIDMIKAETKCDMFYQGDIAKKEVLNEFSEQVIAKYGKVDFLINNACFSNGGIHDSSYDEFLEVQKVCVLAPFMLAKLFKQYFTPNSCIVNISSTRAFQSQENTECYSAAKGGILSLTHSLAVSLSSKVRVNCISPGWIDTENSTLSKQDHEQHLVKRVGTPQDISNAVQFLCSQKASFMTGENIIIDGGMSKLMIYHDDKGWSYSS